MEPVPEPLGEPLEDLVARMAGGDRRALEELYATYADFVQRVLLRYGQGVSEADVPDLVQEVFLTAYDAAPRYRNEGKPRAWLCGIALRLARRSAHRGARRTGLLERFGRLHAPRPAATEDPERLAGQRLAIDRALARLPDAQREILLLHSVEQMSGEEIAAVQGIKVKTVWTRLHRARSKLQRLLDDSSGGRR
jgi:RNA polymerase sigma-70 factor (ECF subfamily)